jgi:transcriptional regulator GlxA family with amidase domain
MAVEEATWERLQEFQDLYPDFQLEDELFVEAGRDVMDGV